MGNLFIALEGPECAGKSTTAMALKKALNSNVLLTREPGTTRVGEKLREILKIHSLNDLSRAALFSASFFNSWESTLKPHLINGGTVITDRWYPSMEAYQGTSGDKITNAYIKNTVNTLKNIGADPTITIIIDVPVEITIERLSHREQLDITELKGEEYFTKVRNNYMQMLLKQRHNFYWVNGKHPTERIVKEILEVIEENIAS